MGRRCHLKSCSSVSIKAKCPKVKRNHSRSKTIKRKFIVTQRVHIRTRTSNRIRRID